SRATARVSRRTPPHRRSDCVWRCGARRARDPRSSTQRARRDTDPARLEHPTGRNTMTVSHHVRVYKSEEDLPREEQLAWKIAAVATDEVDVEQDVVDMIINRIIDNASVAAASLNRGPIIASRAQALSHPVSR